MKRLLLIAAVAIGATSCTTTRVVTVPEVHEVYHHDHDSVHRYDSTYHERETVVMQLDSEAMAQYGIQLQAAERAWLVRTRELELQIQRLIQMKASIDSVRDSIPVPYPVEVEVPAKLTWWQQVRIHGGEVLLGLMGIGLIWFVFKIKRLFF